MCIRDRLLLLCKRLLQLLSGIFLLLFDLRYFLRQLFQICGPLLFKEARNIHFAQRRHIGMQHLCVPVSYTHLDVYKRQHHLGYEPLLCLNELPRIGVKCPFRHIAVDEHLFVGVSLPDGPALPLLYVAWPPRHIQMMLRCTQRLHVLSLIHI